MKSLLSKIYRRTPPIVARAMLWTINATFNVSVAGMFLDTSGKVLLFRHVFRHRYPWGLPGGFIGAGESPEAGLVRELREEAGLDVRPARIVAVNMIAARHLELVLAGELDASRPMRFSHEIFEARFFACNALPADMPPDQRACILKFAGSRAGGA
jgi:ADP-ribose pyrophosphatase YjhB (NUDIX family)